MNNKIFYPLIVLLLAIPFALIAFYWNVVPDTVPIHYNIDLEADRWASKAAGLFMLPCISLFTTVLLLFVPKIDPKGNLEKHMNVYRSIVLATAFFLTGLFSMQLFRYVGYDIPLDFIPLAIVTLMAFIGNVMLKVKPNFFLGIRTPWTLSNDEVWRRTHRVGGYLWVFASVVMLPIILFTPTDVYTKIFMGYIAIIAIVPIGYSLYLYQQLKNTNA